MPFTFAHPAIILPLTRARYRLSAAGLVAGSMAPDFESFLRLGRGKVHGHTWLGVLWYDIPLTYLLLYLYFFAVCRPLVLHLPQALKVKCLPIGGRQWHKYHLSNWRSILISVLVGILSHLFWDAVTHLNFSYPDAITSKIMVGNRRLYIVLQYVCSVLGLAYLFFFVSRSPKKQSGAKGDFSFYWVHVLLVAILIFSVVLTDKLHRGAMVDTIFPVNLGIGSLCYGLIAASLLDSLQRRGYH